MGPDPAPLNDPAGDAADGNPPAGDPRPQPLADLAAGRWSRWPGLAVPTTLDEVVGQLGPSIDPEPHSGTFVGPTMFRRWDARPGAPQGLTVWFEGEVVAGVDVRGARRDPSDPGLPEPDLVLPSGLGDALRQYVWGGRGLVVHRVPGDDAAATLLLGLPPFTAAQWEAHPLRWWASTRRRA